MSDAHPNDSTHHLLLVEYESGFTGRHTYDEPAEAFTAARHYESVDGVASVEIHEVRSRRTYSTKGVR